MIVCLLYILYFKFGIELVLEKIFSSFIIKLNVNGSFRNGIIDKMIVNINSYILL